MVDEAVKGLHINKLAKYIDATLGTGGHSLEILKLGGRVLGIDLDSAMIEVARERLNREFDGEYFRLVHGNFTDIDTIARDNNWEPVAGILFDLGVTNLHLKSQKRGFSFENPDAPLDMRIDPELQGVRGADLLNVLREDQLRELFEATLDPGAAKWIAGRVLHSRGLKQIETVGDMLEICKGMRTIKRGINEATLPFLALRIAVNSELDNLREVLPKAFGLLEKGGRLVVISFHSKEDEIVKNFFKEKKFSGDAEEVTYKPLVAGSSEVEKNRRARSAKMRIIERK